MKSQILTPNLRGKLVVHLYVLHVMAASGSISDFDWYRLCFAKLRLLFLFSLVHSIEVGRHFGLPSPLRSPNLRRRWRAPWWGARGETAHHPHGLKDVAPSKIGCPKSMHCLDHPTQPSPSLFKSHKAACPWNQQEPDEGKVPHNPFEKKNNKTNANAHPWYHGNSHPRVFCGCKICCPRDRRQAVKNRREALLHPAGSTDFRDNEILNTVLTLMHFTLPG